jgi:hypothetical protein
MKFLFWIFALLGLATYEGGPGSRTATPSSINAQLGVQPPQPTSVDTVMISDDGTPPRK